VLDYARPESVARAAQLSRIKGYVAPDWTQHFARVAPFVETLGAEGKRGR
jgi:hypothetical protein